MGTESLPSDRAPEGVERNTNYLPSPTYREVLEVDAWQEPAPNRGTCPKNCSRSKAWHLARGRGSTCQEEHNQERQEEQDEGSK